MKYFLEYLVEIITKACLTFSLTTLTYTLIYALLFEGGIMASVIFQLAFVSFFCAVIQFVFFSGRVIGSMSYGKRILFSFPAFFILLLAAALLFNWFPANRLEAWGAFFGVFVLIFLLILLGFEIYFRIIGDKYDDLLSRYKNREYKG